MPFHADALRAQHEQAPLDRERTTRIKLIGLRRISSLGYWTWNKTDE